MMEQDVILTDVEQLTLNDKHNTSRG